MLDDYAFKTIEDNKNIIIERSNLIGINVTIFQKIPIRRDFVVTSGAVININPFHRKFASKISHLSFHDR